MGWDASVSSQVHCTHATRYVAREWTPRQSGASTPAGVRERPGAAAAAHGRAQQGRTGRGLVEEVADEDGDAELARGHGRARVQHARAEVAQLPRLVVAQAVQAHRLAHLPAPSAALGRQKGTVGITRSLPRAVAGRQLTAASASPSLPSAAQPATELGHQAAAGARPPGLPEEPYSPFQRGRRTCRVRLSPITCTDPARAPPGSTRARLARVRAEHAVHVGPDDDARGAQQRAHDRRTVVAAVAPQRGHLPGRVLGDEASRDEHLHAPRRARRLIRLRSAARTARPDAGLPAHTALPQSGKARLANHQEALQSCTGCSMTRCSIATSHRERKGASAVRHMVQAATFCRRGVTAAAQN